jgi:hypothetical protein
MDAGECETVVRHEYGAHPLTLIGDRPKIIQ